MCKQACRKYKYIGLPKGGAWWRELASQNGTPPPPQPREMPWTRLASLRAFGAPVGSHRSPFGRARLDDALDASDDARLPARLRRSGRLARESFAAPWCALDGARLPARLRRSGRLAPTIRASTTPRATLASPRASGAPVGSRANPSPAPGRCPVVCLGIPRAPSALRSAHASLAYPGAPPSSRARARARRTLRSLTHLYGAPRTANVPWTRLASLRACGAPVGSLCVSASGAFALPRCRPRRLRTFRPRRLRTFDPINIAADRSCRRCWCRCCCCCCCCRCCCSSWWCSSWCCERRQRRGESQARRRFAQVPKRQKRRVYLAADRDDPFGLTRRRHERGPRTTLHRAEHHLKVHGSLLSVDKRAKSE